MRETAYATFYRVAQIKNKAERIEEFRKILTAIPSLSLFIQYTYHPDVVFDLPAGELPPASGFKLSGHDEKGPFYQCIKKLPNFFTSSSVTQSRKQTNFIILCETVASKDYELLIGCKDKKLPWTQLSQKFCYAAVPELFPPQPKSETSSADSDED